MFGRAAITLGFGQHSSFICVKFELDWLDMCINTKKSCCLHACPRFDLPCATITTSNGNSLRWVSEKGIWVHMLLNGEDSRAQLPMPNALFIES